MRFASSGGNSEISRKLDTCRSGSTSRCVSAFGAMSWMATKPSPACTWSPSRTSSQKRQSSGSADPLLGDLGAADADEVAHPAVDEPRRIVVAVAATRPVDEDDVLAPEFPAPADEGGDGGRLREPRAPLPLHLCRDRVGGRGRRSG